MAALIISNAPTLSPIARSTIGCVIRETTRAIAPSARTKRYRPVTISLFLMGKIPYKRSMLFFSVTEKVYPVVMAIKHMAKETPVRMERLMAAKAIGRSMVKPITLI